MLEEFKPIIAKHSIKFGVDSDLIRSIIMVESSGIPYRARFEPDWKYFYFQREYAEKLGITVETETMFQATSWGLMQIMGGVARELGYKLHLTALCNPDLNIEYGTMKIKSIMQRYGNSEMDVIAAYNAGSVIKTYSGIYKNEKYVDKVYSFLRQLRALK